jgi:hypothetical protein
MNRTQVGLTMLRYWNEVFVDPAGVPIYPEYNLAPPPPQADVKESSSLGRMPYAPADAPILRIAR